MTSRPLQSSGEVKVNFQWGPSAVRRLPTVSNDTDGWERAGHVLVRPAHLRHLTRHRRELEPHRWVTRRPAEPSRWAWKRDWAVTAVGYAAWRLRRLFVFKQRNWPLISHRKVFSHVDSGINTSKQFMPHRITRDDANTTASSASLPSCSQHKHNFAER